MEGISREKARFQEPHIPCAVLWEIVSERQRECAVLRAAHSLSCFVGDGRERKRQCADLRTPHPLSCFVGDGTREEETMCGSKSPTFSLMFLSCKWDSLSRVNVRFFEPCLSIHVTNAFALYSTSLSPQILTDRGQTHTIWLAYARNLSLIFFLRQ